jgi:hypothetical protein
MASQVFASDQELLSIPLSIPATLLTTVMVIVTIAGGLFPRYLFQLAVAAVQHLL